MHTSDWQKLKSVTISNTSEDVRSRSYEKHLGKQFAISSYKAAGPLLLSSGISPLEILSYSNSKPNAQILFTVGEKGRKYKCLSTGQLIYIRYSLNGI